MKRRIICHVPHSSLYVPEELKKTIKLNDTEFNEVRLVLTDLHMDKMMSFMPEDLVLVAPVSRFIVDMERFTDDEQESMSKIGMGVCYTRDHEGRELRDINEAERNELINEYYVPHHEKLTEMTESSLNETGSAFILDCHSFSDKMSYTGYDNFPDICIGTDDFHTPKELTDKVVKFIEEQGYKVGVNVPFAGSLTPMKYYCKDKRVKSMMIELDKKIYTNGFDINTEGFNKLQELCKGIVSIIESYEEL